MSKRNHRHADRAAGFTLFEMLVALILMVGILVALASVTAQWLPNWNRGFAHVQRTELFAQGLERLVADLSAAEFVTANGRAKQPLFDGDELAVRFVRTAIGPNTRPGLEVVRISTMSDNRGVAIGARAHAVRAASRERQTPRPGEFLGPGGAHARALSGDFFVCGPRSCLAKQLARREPTACRHPCFGARRGDATHAGGFNGHRPSHRRAGGMRPGKRRQGVHLPAGQCAARRFVQSRQMKKWRRKAVT